jgi:hypothetical protein
VWKHLHGSTSPQETDVMQMPRGLLTHVTAALCYAA